MLFRIAPLNDSFYALVQCCNVSLAISHLLNRRVVRSHIGRNAGGQGNGFTAWREMVGIVSSRSYFEEIPLCPNLDLLVG